MSLPGPFSPGKDPVPIVQEVGRALGPFWKGAGNLEPPTGYDPRTVQTSASHCNCLKNARYDIEVTRSSKFCNAGSITKFCNQIYEPEPHSDQCITD
jgi:hypothetical protein